MRKLLNWFRGNLVAGLLVLLPIYVTGRILLLLFNVLDGALGPTVNRFIQAAVPGWKLHVPGTGLVFTVILVVLVGWATRYLVFKRLIDWMDLVFAQIPLVRSIYAATRQFIDLLRGGGHTPFQQVVMIEYPMPGCWTMGLLSRSSVSTPEGEDSSRVVVFVPSNHLHLGYPVVLPRESVRPIEMAVEDAVKFFVSCGVLLNGTIRTDGRLPEPE